ncbi:hypothetical protein SAY87_019414 [Trapa incisa]|uniref:NAC domain-containing protein n=1 Tax=Trapa incisa TaxID=236973 RepID=A0AAN7JZ69_9MYRT|nr:hypothetical protein SAY87_019414 [Trapa incisa]
MEMKMKQSSVIRLPPGFRFHPTDEELVVQYLKRKVYSFPLPASIIPEVDVCKLDPWDLPGHCSYSSGNDEYMIKISLFVFSNLTAGDMYEERYFFSTREAKYSNGNRSNRTTASGYWKAAGIDRQVVASRGSLNQLVGMKKTLVFYRGKPPKEARTYWVMHEYRLPSSDYGGVNLIQGPENWVVCRIFLKKMSKKSNSHKDSNRNDGSIEVADSDDNRSPMVFYDFMGKNGSHKISADDTDRPAVRLPLPDDTANSDSSCVTGLSYDEHEQEELEESSSNRQLQ